MMERTVYGNRFRGDPARGRWHNLARHCCHQGRAWGLHQHDYYELFWLESGRIQHSCDGRSQLLAPGQIAFLRPEHTHTAEAVDEGGATWVNVELPRPSIEELGLRYPDIWPWRPGPCRYQALDGPALARLEAWSTLLAIPGASRLDSEAFILEAARLATAPSAPVATRGLPTWLTSAVDAMQRSRHFSGGVPLLARLAGRSQEHVARTVRACQDRRALDLVNELRLTFAAVELRLSDQPIASLAAACGLPNLGHFYRLFHRAYGCTPAAFRRAARGAVP